MKRALAWLLDLLPLTAYAVYAAPTLLCRLYMDAFRYRPTAFKAYVPMEYR